MVEGRSQIGRRSKTGDFGHTQAVPRRRATAAKTRKTFSRVFFILPLTLLSSPALTTFTNEQVQQLALLTLQTNRLGPGIALAFFGVSGLLNGYLIFKSTFLPRWMGVISMAGSLGWMAFFYPPLGSQLFMFIAALALIGAAIKIFWFLVYGVDEEKWKKRTAEIAVI